MANYWGYLRLFCEFYCFVFFNVVFRLCAPSVAAAATRPPGSAGSSSSFPALWLPRRPWHCTPSWRQKRTTSTSTASGTCWLRAAWVSCCHREPSPTPKWPLWSVAGAAGTSSASTNTKRWAWWTQPSSPSTASAPADNTHHASERHSLFAFSLLPLGSKKRDNKARELVTLYIKTDWGQTRTLEVLFPFVILFVLFLLALLL